MSGNKILQILLAVAIFATIGITAASAYEMADSFQNPMANYVINNHNRFGEYLSDFSSYHAGEDLQVAAAVALNTEVRAIANGRVVWVQKNSAAKGYGQAVVIEHKLPDNTQIISIYGHLSRQKYLITPDQDVVKGQLLGYIGETWENGGWAPHLHMGIKKGPWDNVNKLFEGRTDLAGLAKFNKPSDFLNLIRSVNTNDVYRLSNLGSKAYVSAASMTSCGWRPDDVRLVSSTEMSNHPTFTAQSVCFAANTFIKRDNNPEISQIKNYADKPKPNRYRQPFGSWEAYIRAGGKNDLSNVRKVSNEEYNLHVQGATIT